MPLAAVMASLTALGEELGWRGYLQSVTQQWGFWRSAVAVSGAFTAFHVPLMWHSWPPARCRERKPSRQR